MPFRNAAFAVLVWLICSGTGHAQPNDIVYCRQPVFRIPFEIQPSEVGRVREVQLFILDPGAPGRQWRHYAAIGPEQKSFQFRADRDGLYWFSVRTLDRDGRYVPANIDRMQPGLKVAVDTQPPLANLRPVPARRDGDQAGPGAPGFAMIEWDVRDENLDIQSLVIDYRVQGAPDWHSLSIDPQAIGQKSWTPAVRGPLEVRLRVRDRADNQTNAQAFVSGSGGQAFGQNDAGPYQSHSPSTRSVPYQSPAAPVQRNLVPAGPNVKVVNTTNIPLNYSVDEVGPSGVSLVELWYTLDSRNWQRYGEDEDRKSPLMMQVNGEGVYGLSLVVRSGVGFGDRPPQLNDPPQMWIEVDTTKPIVQLFSAEPGRGSDSGNMAITWSASDKNLGPQPISIYYGDRPDSSWQPIATNVENTGRFVWKIPANAPYQFLVRVEAADRGGNIGRAETSRPVVVDLAIPKGRLIGVDGPVKAP